MAVITMSREAGSGGDQIARDVADALGYRLVDKAFLERVLDQYGFIEFDHEYDSIPSFWEKFDSQKAERRAVMMDLLNQVILATARRGRTVIVGRSGFAALSGFVDVLHVRIQAPLEVRVGRRVSESGIERAAAEQELELIGRTRAGFVKRFYGADWTDARGFDLVINTSRIDPALAVRTIVEAAERLDTTDQGPKTSSIEVDPVVRSAVESSLAAATPRTGD